jgi:hypothetical protein
MASTNSIFASFTKIPAMHRKDTLIESGAAGYLETEALKMKVKQARCELNPGPV